MQQKTNNNEKEFEDVFGTYFIMLSKPMIKIFGLEAALLLCDLYSEYRYWKTKNRLQIDGSFFSTIENVEHNTGLTGRQQGPAIKKLIEYGILSKSVRGMPSKRYFSFNIKGLQKLRKDIRTEIKKDKERITKRREQYGMDDMIGIYDYEGLKVDKATGEVYF